MRRTGGIAKAGHRKKDISDGTVYWNPNYAKIAMEHLRVHLPKPPYRIFDSCSNLRVLGQAVCQVVGEENVEILEGQDKAIDGKDALTYVPNFTPNVIVCNPPWKESFAKPLYHHLKSLLSDDGVMFFNINLVFMYQGWERAIDLHCSKFYFLPRYVFKGSGRPLLDCGFAVYHKGFPPLDTLRNDVFIHLPKDK